MFKFSAAITLLAFISRNGFAASSDLTETVLGKNAMDRKKIVALFKEWTKEFEKSYETVEEETRRMLIWMENHEVIARHNSQKERPSFILGHNQFSDMTNEEFKRYNNLDVYEEPSNGKVDVAAISEQRRMLRKKKLPKNVDWVAQGAVTPVKDQGRCGSCWAFSTTGSIESAKFIQSGQLVSLSEKELVDCDKLDLGCNGGLMARGFMFDELEGGLCSEDSYPYHQSVGSCEISNCTKVEGTLVKSYSTFENGDSDGLLASIATQPTSIAMAAGNLEFQLYHSGVYNSECSNQPNHGVLAVGYGTDEETGLDFIKVKNSWGSAWGEEGYFRISSAKPVDYYGDVIETGLCAIYTSLNSAPTL